MGQYSNLLSFCSSSFHPTFQPNYDQTLRCKWLVRFKLRLFLCWLLTTVRVSCNSLCPLRGCSTVTARFPNSVLMIIWISIIITGAHLWVWWAITSTIVVPTKCVQIWCTWVYKRTFCSLKRDKHQGCNASALK